jgi:CheY-like chemotaxis protein
VKRRIPVPDDNQPNRDLLDDWLESQGFECERFCAHAVSFLASYPWMTRYNYGSAILEDGCHRMVLRHLELDESVLVLDNQPRSQTVLCRRQDR